MRGIIGEKMEEQTMNAHVIFALGHPVFDPERQIVRGHYWRADRDVTACLSVNLGLE